VAKATCSVENCGRPGRSNGWCQAHYLRLMKVGDVQADIPIRVSRPGSTCVVDGCERLIHGRGFCKLHYLRWSRSGEVGGPQSTRRVNQGTDCSVNSCGRPADSRGYCVAHHLRWLTSGDVRAQVPIMEMQPQRGRPCSMKDCEKDAFSRGLCRPHWRRKHQAEKPWIYTDAQAARTARTRTTRVERVRRIDVFDRDGWVCLLCHVSIDPGLKYPDPMSASIDHIVPLARGGVHSMANCQAAHLGCNVRKGSRLNVGDGRGPVTTGIAQ
jgi:5-methylcytosine-specific restriction endonuclease McrA